MNQNPATQFDRAQSDGAAKVAGELTKVAVVGSVAAVAKPVVVAAAAPVVAAATSATVAATTATVSATTAAATAVVQNAPSLYLKAGMLYDKLNNWGTDKGETANFFIGLFKGGIKALTGLPVSAAGEGATKTAQTAGINAIDVAGKINNANK